jgi:hypothetical protein
MAIGEQTITLKSFAGGQRDRDHPSEIFDDQYSYGKNIENRSGGLYDTRRGRTKKVNSPGSSPQGACWFSPAPSIFFIIEVNGGRIFKWEGSSQNFTEIDPTVQLVNTQNPVSFGVLNQKIGIFAGPDDNVWSWNGTAATLTDEGNANTDPPRTSLVSSQSGKLIAGKTDTAGTDNSLYPCSPNDITTWDRSSSNVRIPSEGDEGVTALAMYLDATILAFTRRTSHLLTVNETSTSSWTRKTLQTKIGSISPWVSVVGNEAFFMSGDGQIRSIRRTEFGESQAVITPISYWNPNLMARVKRTKLSKTRGVWYDNYLLVGACLDNSDTNNGVIVFDTQNQIASPSGPVPVCLGEWTNMRPGEWIEAFFNNRQQLYYMDALDGSLYLMFDGEDDDGETIESETHMKALDFGTQRNDKTMLDGELMVIDTYGTVTIDYAKDDATFNEIIEEDVGTSGGASLPFTLPVTLGSGGVLQFIPFSFFGAGQSRFWQPKVVHSGGVLSLKQLTLRAQIEE